MCKVHKWDLLRIDFDTIQRIRIYETNVSCLPLLHCIMEWHVNSSDAKCVLDVFQSFQFQLIYSGAENFALPYKLSVS